MLTMTRIKSPDVNKTGVLHTVFFPLQFILFVKDLNVIFFLLFLFYIQQMNILSIPYLNGIFNSPYGETIILTCE